MTDFCKTSVNFDDFKCRCSAVSKILANSRSNPVLSERQTLRLGELEAREKLTEVMQKELADLLVRKANGSKVVLSDTAIAYLMEWYSWETEQMISVSKESLETLQMKKGILAQKQAAELLGFVDNTIYKEHKERIFNDFLTGELDLYLGADVYSATNVTDIKNSFDYPTFLRKVSNIIENAQEGLEDGQEEQVQGYCDITGASEGWIANCLVDNPDEIIEDMKWKIAKKMNAVTIEHPEFLAEWETWERSMKFSHIHPNKRVFKIPIARFTDFKRQKVYDRVKICREWLWNFDEKYQTLNKPHQVAANGVE